MHKNRKPTRISDIHCERKNVRYLSSKIEIHIFACIYKNTIFKIFFYVNIQLHVKNIYFIILYLYLIGLLLINTFISFQVPIRQYTYIK